MAPYEGLLPYGWDAGWEQAFAAAARPDDIPARVVRVDRGAVDAAGPEGRLRVQVPPRAETPVTGDWACVEADGDILRLCGLLERRTLLARKAAGEADERQPMAANVGAVGVVLPLDRPVNVRLRDRLLLLAWESGAQPLLIFTKRDLAGPDALKASENPVPGVSTLHVSTVRSEGFSILGAAIAEAGTVALVGPSGAGKSTMVNALLGEGVERIGEVRAFDQKGRHTTTARALHLLPGGGAVIDTPGLRAAGLWDAEEGLERLYPQIAALAENCRFRDCVHENEPGCAVRAALEAGTLDSAEFAHWEALVEEEVALLQRRRQHERRAAERAATLPHTRAKRRGRRD